MIEETTPSNREAYVVTIEHYSGKYFAVTDSKDGAHTPNQVRRLIDTTVRAAQPSLSAELSKILDLHRDQ